ncbi:MAG: TrmH family RNA methyltransferase [Balneolia bacterium]|nr:TrmH family RNA methyltransferase [Balneolia bacterium]
MSRNAKRTTRQILEDNLSRKAPVEMQQLKVWLHNIRSMHNVGSAFRSCDALGAGELVLTGYTPQPPRPEISKTALGADESVVWKTPPNPIDEIKRLKTEGYRLIGIEQTKNSLLIDHLEVKPNDKIILFFGNEVTGLDDELLPLMENCYEIPQYGQKHSLNVSVSIGITLYHILDRCP